MVNSLYYDLKDDMEKLSEYTVIKNVFRFLNNKKIWELFSHTGINVKYDELRRMIVHILFQLLVFEKRLPEYYDKYELLLNKFENANLPYEWYSVQSENNKETNIIEVNTIHSSKGLEYDNVLIVTDISEMLSPNFYTNLSKYGERYGTMFNIKFKKVLTNNPEIEFNFFPYLGTKTAKILKNCQERDNIYLYEDFLNIKKSIINETMNLLYVAITRSRKNILLLNCSRSENFTLNNLEFENIYTESVIENGKPLLQLKKLSNNTGREIIQISDVLEKINVRNFIKNKYAIKHANTTSDLKEKYEWTKTGTAVHFFLEFLLKNKDHINDINDINKILDGFNNQNLTEEQKKAIEIIKNEKNKEQKEKIVVLCKNYEKFKNEVKIIAHKDNYVITGSIDSLGINKNKYLLIEYKVTFKDEEITNKEAEGVKQVDTYKDLFLNLDKNLILDKPFLIILYG